MRAANSTCRIVEFLREAQHYSERPRRIEVIETHFAWVFLTDSHAYKLKKPVMQDRMDYRTLAARRRGCRNELTLNRRLAATVYLAVVPITSAPDGRLVLGRSGIGRVVDWVVKMRRLPAERMLDCAIAEKSVRAQDLEAIARRLARFFAGAARRPMSASRYIARLRSRTLLNRHQLSAPELGLDERRVCEVSAMQLAFITQNEALLGRRGAQLIDGHGDLRPEHLYLGSGPDEPCVIDCLEFDDDLRRLDPAEEMAFLVLECRKLGARGVARILLARYLRDAANPPPKSLIHFYMSERASTRAKIAAWHLHDARFAPQAALWRARAHSYLADAARYIRRAVREPTRDAKSALELHRPTLEHRGERLARHHPAHGLAE
jgi:aminoglycoside phosphotransferase family enzyme